jgi:hypothetical protein
MRKPDRLLDVTEQFLTPFYSKTMACDRFIHSLWNLHFSNNHNALDRKPQPITNNKNQDVFLT